MTFDTGNRGQPSYNCGMMNTEEPTDSDFMSAHIEALQKQNAALVAALEAITGGKEQMVDWCIIINAHHGVAGWNNAALRKHIATQALALAEGD